MNETIVTWCSVVAVGLALFALPSVADAQEDFPKTIPRDNGFDQHTEITARLPGATSMRPPVDRLDEVDAFAHQGALFGTAHVPQKGSVIYSNHLFYGHNLRYVPRERFMLSGLVVLSPRNLGLSASADSDFFAGLTGKIALYKSHDLDVSIQTGGLFRSGRYPIDTREVGGRLAALIDYKVSDVVMLYGGLEGYLPFWAGIDEVDISQCATRDDFFDEDCIQADPRSVTMPAGGRFLIGYIGAALYAGAGLNFKMEAYTSASGGSILGLEGPAYNTDDIETQVMRIEGGHGVMIGPTSGAPFGANVGVGWSRKGFGAQLAVIWVPKLREMVDQRSNPFLPNIFPMSTIGYKF